MSVSGDVDCGSVCRAENYETEESSEELVTFEEERQKQLVSLISYRLSH